MTAIVHDSLGRAGFGALTVRNVAGQSTVTAVRSASPLKLLTPRSRGPSVWAYTSSFGGGLVAGDQTRLDLRIEAGARCFLGTQASTKVYRNPRQIPCGHQTRAVLGPEAVLVFAPDPVQAFADSCYVQKQEFRLAADASLVLLDWFTAGRAARGERWQFRRLRTRNSVYVEPAESTSGATSAVAATSQPGSGSDSIVPSGPGASLAFLDSIALDADDGPIASVHRTGRHRCFATLLFLGPAVAPVAGAMLAEVQAKAVERNSALLASASPIRDGAVLRLAGVEVEAIGAELRRHLAPVAALLGDDPWARKW